MSPQTTLELISSPAYLVRRTSPEDCFAFSDFAADHRGGPFFLGQAVGDASAWGQSMCDRVAGVDRLIVFWRSSRLGFFNSQFVADGRHVATLGLFRDARLGQGVRLACIAAHWHITLGYLPIVAVVSPENLVMRKIVASLCFSETTQVPAEYSPSNLCFQLEAAQTPQTAHFSLKAGILDVRWDESKGIGNVVERRCTR